MWSIAASACGIAALVPLTGCAGSSSGGQAGEFILIPAAGGVVPVPGSRAKLIIPAGAVAADRQVGFSLVNNPTGAPAGVTFLDGTGVRFDATTFASAIEVVLNFNGLGLSPAEENRLRVFRSGDGTTWTEAATALDVGAKTATTTTTTFSLFCLGVKDHGDNELLISPMGGTVSVPGTPITLVVPPGAVAMPTIVSFSDLGPVTNPPAGAEFIEGSGVRFSSTSFSEPVTVRIDLSNLGVLPVDLPRTSVYRREGPGAGWELMETDVNVENRTISTQTMEFSDFGGFLRSVQTWIYMDRRDGQVAHLRRWDQDGNLDPSYHVTVPGFTLFAHVSRNNQKIVYEVQSMAAPRLAIADIDGNNELVLPTPDQVSAFPDSGFAQFSPDSARLVYSYARNIGGNAVQVIRRCNADGSGNVAIGQGTPISWYPDSAHILVANFSGGHSEISYSKVRILDGHSEPVTGIGFHAFAGISPTAPDLLFSDIINEKRVFGWYPNLQAPFVERFEFPAVVNFNGPTWAPDGEGIYFTTYDGGVSPGRETGMNLYFLTKTGGSEPVKIGQESLVFDMVGTAFK
ncbi:MAG: hypothetical protein ACK4XJ_06160 [Fimbriimonadaceae bacterium]